MCNQAIAVKFKQLSDNFKLPAQSTEDAAGFDLYMPQAGHIPAGGKTKVMLGFAAAVPRNHVAIIVPRSGVGARDTLELANTAGVIDADYRGEWMASLKTKDGKEFSWEAGDRLLQAIVIPVPKVTLELVDSLDDTKRGEGGYGSTGK